MDTILLQIDSVDVTATVRDFSYERSFGDTVGEADVEVTQKITSLVTLTNGMRVECWRNAYKVFDGFLERYEPQAGVINLVCKDKLIQLVWREVNNSYLATGPQAGKISDIFTDIVTSYGGLTADATSVQDSGTTITIKKFVCNHADPLERCKNLADAIDWQFYYRADTDKVYFEPKGYLSNANTITVGQEIVKTPKWKVDVTEMMNDITVVGAYQEIGSSENFTGDASTTTFVLLKTPISVAVYYNAAKDFSTENPLDGDKKVGSVDGGYSAAYDYYVDKPNKSVICTSFTPAASANNLQVQYTYAVPTPVEGTDSMSISTYGLFKKTVILSDIRTAADAETRLNNLLAKYSTPFYYTDLSVKDAVPLDIQVGQKISVVDGVNNITRQVLINRHSISWPSQYDQIFVGDREWRLAEWGAHIMEKLQRLEEQEIENQDIIVKLTGLNTSAQVKRKELIIYTSDPQDSCVYDGECNSILDYDLEYNETTHKYEGTFSNATCGTDGKIRLVAY